MINCRVVLSLVLHAGLDLFGESLAKLLGFVKFPVNSCAAELASVTEGEAVHFDFLAMYFGVSGNWALATAPHSAQECPFGHGANLRIEMV